MFPKLKRSKQTVYLDHAATTYVDPKVLKAMQPYWQQRYGNPSSLYQKGREASLAVESSRKAIAELINARASEIVFTAGGTESVNLAIFGVARKHGHADGKRPHLLTSMIEHHAVLHSFEALNRQGFLAQTVGVDKQGFVKMDELRAAIRPETVLISIMYANNEIGTVQPIAEIGEWLRKENEKRKASGLPKILFHSDACQAAGALDLNVQKLGVDLLSVNGSKIYGPKQTGFLYVRTGIDLEPVVYGGGQERNLRSGTENVPGIVGLAQALRLAQKGREKENRRLEKLRAYFIEQVCKKISDVTLNGPDPLQKDVSKVGSGRSIKRLPNNINLSFQGLEGEAMMLYLDSYNISVATGSACTTGSPDPSHVLVAIGLTDDLAQSSIRFTLGHQTSRRDLDYVLKVLPGVVAELRKLRGT